jgi:uncharacterized protein (TIGR02271 family)
MNWINWLRRQTAESCDFRKNDVHRFGSARSTRNARERFHRGLKRQTPFFGFRFAWLAFVMMTLNEGGKNMQNDTRTIVGAFSSYSSAMQAADQLRHAGYAKVRMVENQPMDSSGPNYPGKQAKVQSEPKKSGIAGFFARLFNLDEDRPNWKLSPDSEEYFQDAYRRNQHLLIVEDCNDKGRCHEIIRSMGGTVEDRGGQIYERELQRVMQLRGEVLDVRKDRVQTGDVQLRKEIITETRSIEVPVTREEFVVERHSVEGTTASRDHNDANVNVTRQIRIPLSEEQVHIEKKLVPREEVRVYKDKITETQTFSEDVLHEEARLETEGKVRIRDNAAKGRPLASDRGQDGMQPGV